MEWLGFVPAFSRCKKECLSVKEWQERGILTGVSVCVGIVVGGLTAVFGRVLIAITEFRSDYFWWLIPFLAVSGMAFVWVFDRYGGQARGGMSLVFKAGHGSVSRLPKRLIPFVAVGTWLAHLFGASVGREGVAVQIGSVVANQWRGLFASEKYRRLLVTIGMASGFAGLFGTPLAATFFAMEVLVVGQWRFEGVGYTLLASVTATTVAGLCGLEKFTVALPHVSVEWREMGLYVVLGVAFGLAGRLFSVGLKQLKRVAATYFENPVIRIGVIGVGVSLAIALLGGGRYAGLGTNLISLSTSGGAIYWYDWVLKLVLTIVSLAAGYQGGEVTPLFAIGASLGAVLAPVLGVPVLVSAAVGYAAVFGSATNTLLAPILIGGEVFGFDYLPYFVVVCTVAFLVNGNHSIYSEQKLLTL